MIDSTRNNKWLNNNEKEKVRWYDMSGPKGMYKHECKKRKRELSRKSRLIVFVPIIIIGITKQAYRIITNVIRMDFNTII